MIAELKPYPVYKESGLPWLERVPSHWQSERAKWLFRRVYRPVRPEDEVITCFRDGLVTLRKNRRLVGFTEATTFSGYQGIRSGDLVIHGMDAFAGAIGVSDSDGKGTPVYSVCQPRSGVNAHFYAYLLREMARSQWILALAKGIRERSTDFRFETFGNQRLPLIPTAEQAAIVRFLNWANHRLDRALRAKQRVIALLKEQKDAIVYQAVTGGNDPGFRLRPSGIPWLGNIPQHWGVRRAKYLFQSIDERSTGGEEELLTVSSSDGIVPRSSKTVMMFKAASYAGHKLCWPGDLVINSLWAWAHGLGFSSYHGIVSTAYGVYRPRPPYRSHIKYWHELLRSRAYDWEFHVRSKGIWKSRLQLTDDSFLAMPIVVPPDHEAVAIAQQIQESTTGLTNAVSRLERELELLREYRARLCKDVVTGKLDVREMACRLPDEPEESMEKDVQLETELKSLDEIAAV